MTNRKEDIAVVGIALRTAFAENKEEFWQNLLTGKDCIHEIADQRQKDCDDYLPHLYKIKIDDASRRNKKRYLNAGYLKDIDRFDFRFFRMSPKEASLMDPAQRVFLEVAYHAFEDAGYAGESIKGSSTGVYVGYSDDVKLNYFQMVTQIEPESIPVAIAGNLSSIVPTRISYFLDLKGPGLLIDTACSSSLVALHLACQAICNGDCQQAIAGGVRYNLIPIANVAKVGIESSDGRTRTFDDSSDGTGTGEGAAAVLLKPLHKALEDGDHIYAVIKGSAVNQDGHSQGITAPDADAQKDVLVKAWNNAGIRPDSLSFIEAHGTGTRVGDPTEVEAVTRAFSQFTDKKQFCAIGSVKTNIGHLFEASGIFGFIKAAMSIRHRVFPPILHFNRPHRDIDFEDSPVYINDQIRQWPADDKPLCGGVTAFGFSGTNCHVVLSDYAQSDSKSNRLTQNETESPEAPHCLLVLSAKSKFSLTESARQMKRFLSENKDVPLLDICYTLALGRGHFDHRVALTGKNHHQMIIQLETFLNCKEKQSTIAYSSDQDDQPQPFQSIIQCYLNGETPDWDTLFKETYPGLKPRRVSLPLYVFERNRCWLEFPAYQEQAARPLEGKLYFDMQWLEDQLVPKDESQKSKNNGVTIVVSDDSGVGEQLVSELTAGGTDTVQVKMGTGFQQLKPKCFQLDGSEKYYEKLILSLDNRVVERVIFLPTLQQPHAMASLTKLRQSQKRGAYNLFHLTKMLLKHHPTEKINYIVIADYVNRVTRKEKTLKPENAPLFGLAYAIDQECENITTRCIDIDETCTLELLLTEIQAEKQYRLSAYRNGHRYIERFTPVQMQDIAQQPVTVKEKGVYLITGGTGGIGLEVGKYLAKGQKGVRVVFVNRTPMPDPEKWDEILYDEEDKRTCQKIAGIREIEALGADVLLYSADCSDRSRMKEIIEELRNKYGGIDGIIHSAGVQGEGLLVRKSEKKFSNVLNPKIQGTWILDRLTRNHDLDFFVTFSSVATFLMNPGQTDYTAANAFLDTFSWYRNAQGKKTVTLNWVTWKETGMAVNFNANFDIIFKAIPTAQAIDAFEEVLNRDYHRVLIGELNLHSKLINLLKNAQFRLAPEIAAIIDTREQPAKHQGSDSQRKKIRKVKLTGGTDDKYSPSELLVARIWGEVLGFDELRISDNFYELGGDSILATQVVNRINQEKNLKISLIEIFNYETIKELAQYVDSKQ